MIAALFVQTTFAPALAIHGAVPSFVTVALVLFTLRRGVRRGAMLATLAGALTDIVAGTGGGWTLADLVVALGCGAVRSRFFADGIVLPSLLVGAMVLLRNAVFWIVMIAQGYPRGFGTLHAHAALEQALYTALVAVAVQALRARFADPAERIARFA